MLISTKGRYALRVLVDLAEQQPDIYIPLKEVAGRQEISEKYLEALIKELVKGGILVGMRGKGGGYRLSIPPDRISVLKILQLMEGTLSPVNCLEANSEPCARMSECRTIHLWQGLNSVIEDYLSRYTIADLMQTEQAGNDYVI